jgi:HEAT repeat protein
MSEDLAWAIENMSSQDRSLRPEAFKIIDQAREQAVPRLLDVLRQYEDAKRQEIAIDVLWELFRRYGIRHPDLVPALVEAIESNVDNSPLVVLDGIGLLADLKDPNTFDDFIRFIPDKSHGNSDILREGAVEGLGLLADPRAIPYLANTLNDELELIRGRAFWALGRIAEQYPSEVMSLIEQLRTVDTSEASELLENLERNRNDNNRIC